MSTPFENKKLALMTKTLSGGSFPPSLKCDMYKDNPQLFVLTGNKKGEGITYVRAGLEHKTAGLLCQIIETMADKVISYYKTGVKPDDFDENTIVSIECKQGKDRETVSKVVVGKLKDNKMFISVISTKDQATPVIQFIFGPDLYHPTAVTGSEQFEASLSALAAKEWAVRTRMYWYMYSIANPNEDQPEYQGGAKAADTGGYNANSNATAPASGEVGLPWDS